MTGKKPYKLCKINDAGGDLRKQWYVYFYLLDHNTGKFQRKREYVSLTMNASQRYAQLQALKEALDGLLISGEIISEQKVSYRMKKAPTLIEACLEVLQLKRPDITQRTFNSFSSYFKMLEQWLKKKRIHGILAKDFSPGMANDLMNEMRMERNWSAKSFNVARGILRSIFQTLVTNETIPSNPFEKVPTKKEIEPELRIWTDEEQAELSSYLKEHDPAMYLACALVYFTMLRPNEIIQLRFQDFDLKAGVIRVSAGIAKNRKSKPVTMNDTLANLVKAYQGTKADNCFLFGSHFAPDPEKHIHRNVMSYRFNMIRKKIGLHEDLTMYSLKHKGNLDLLMKHNIDPIRLRDQNRHHSLAMTQIYTRRILNAADPELKNLDFNL